MDLQTRSAKKHPLQNLLTSGWNTPQHSKHAFCTNVTSNFSSVHFLQPFSPGNTLKTTRQAAPSTNDHDDLQTRPAKKTTLLAKLNQPVSRNYFLYNKNFAMQCIPWQSKPAVGSLACMACCFGVLHVNPVQVYLFAFTTHTHSISLFRFE